jgi:hypothetical protein
MEKPCVLFSGHTSPRENQTSSSGARKDSVGTYPEAANVTLELKTALGR